MIKGVSFTSEYPCYADIRKEIEEATKQEKYSGNAEYKPFLTKDDFCRDLDLERKGIIAQLSGVPSREVNQRGTQYMTELVKAKEAAKNKGTNPFIEAAKMGVLYSPYEKHPAQYAQEIAIKKMY